MNNPKCKLFNLTVSLVYNTFNISKVTFDFIDGNTELSFLKDNNDYITIDSQAIYLNGSYAVMLEDNGYSDWSEVCWNDYEYWSLAGIYNDDELLIIKLMIDLHLNRKIDKQRLKEVEDQLNGSK